MPGTGEIVPVLELMKSIWLQRVIGNQSHWIQVDSGQLKQETVHTLTHTHTLTKAGNRNQPLSKNFSKIVQWKE